MFEVRSCEVGGVPAPISLSQQWFGIVWHCWVSMLTSHTGTILAHATMKTKACTLL
jgi:hypothetical protein